MFLQNFTKLKNQHEIILNTFSLSLIISKTAIETWAQEMNGRTNWGESWTAQQHTQSMIHCTSDLVSWQPPSRNKFSSVRL